jgi:galactokinase
MTAISSTRLVAHFESLGMTAAEGESKAALFHEAEQQGREFIGGSPQWRWFVPGRVEIVGKHTGYAGGRSLLAAVPRGIAVIARARTDGVVRLHDVRDGQRIEVDPSRPAPPGYRGLRRYVHVVARRLFLNFPGCQLGADLAIASDLPRASGLSSSSALVCGVASALARRAALCEREEWQTNIPTVTALAWYLGCVENGLDYQGLPGTSGVGTHGGSEDHTAIMTGRLHHVSQYQFVPVTPLGDVPMPSDWSFVIASSGVQADKADSVRDRYNRAANGVRALHAAWNARAEHPARSLAAALGSAPGAVQRLRNWIADSADDRYTNQDLCSRLQHFINEDSRVPSAAEAFASGDTAAIGHLSRESQHDAHVLLGNQIPETMALAAAACETGAFAASSFGAGFGGSVWALVRGSDAERFARDWIERYAAVMPSVGPVPWFTARPGPPLTELPTE